MSLRAKLTISFVALAVVPLAALAIFIHLHINAALSERTLAQLESIAEISENRFAQAVAQDRETARLIASRLLLKESLAAYGANAARGYREQITRIIEGALLEGGNLARISILDASGRAVARASRAGSPGAAEARDGNGANDPGLLSLDDSGRMLMRLREPLLLDGEVIGAVDLLMDATSLVAIATDYAGLGRSGEVLLARRLPGGDAEFLTPSRFRSTESSRRVVPRDQIRVPISQAFAGREATFLDAVDYRGVPVLAVTRYIAEHDLGVVAKIDRDEALEPVTAARTALTIAVAVALLGAAVVSLVSARLISRPIIRLGGVARRIHGGELSVRSGYRANDEIGELARAFDAMAGSLLKHQRDLETRNAELQRFAFVASHDLQEPLRKVQAFGDRIREDYREALDDRGRDYMDRMINATRRMQTLIEDLLTLSRVSTHGRRFERVDLSTVLAEVLSDLEQRITESGAEVESGWLPSIQADPVQVRQLFQNLIGNAMKFHRPGQVPRVRVSCSIEKRAAGIGGNGNADSCVIIFEDNGIGIDPDHVARIFEPFQRLHGRNEYEGTGVGLAICERIIRRHRGSIEVERAPDGGSRFMVTLPVVQADGDQAALTL